MVLVIPLRSSWLYFKFNISPTPMFSMFLVVIILRTCAMEVNDQILQHHVINIDIKNKGSIIQIEMVVNWKMGESEKS